MAGQMPPGQREPIQALMVLSLPPHYRDFLPRGSGIVTRRPLVLQLVNATTGTRSASSPTGPLQPPHSIPKERSGLAPELAYCVLLALDSPSGSGDKNA